MSFTQTVPWFINQVQPPVLPVSNVKTEAPMVIKNEPPESEMIEIGVDNILDSSESEEKFVPDIKDTDIVWHPLCIDSIKTEIVTEDIFETKYLESVKTQVYVKTENFSFVKTENIIQNENLNKTEVTSDGNESWGTGQGMVEVLGANEHFNASGNLEADLKSIGTNSRKSKHPEKIDFVQCYKTVETTSREKEKEIKVIKASVIPVEPHEYTSLAKDKHVCNHCQHSSKTLKNLKLHIKGMHRNVTTMYQCTYCLFKSKSSLRDHVIQKHKSAKDIQWSQCYLCEKKFKLKHRLNRHMNDVHLTHKQMQNRSELCLICGKKCTHNKREKGYCCEKCAKERHLKYRCDKCSYKTSQLYPFNKHKLTHLKPEEIQYFYCYHCSYKNKQKQVLKKHIFRHFRNEDVPFHCYMCDFMTLKRDLMFEHFKKHPEHHSKLDTTKYQHETLKNYEKRYSCDQCDYITYEKGDLKRHKLVHLKPEEIDYFYCYHCSFKSKRKGNLQTHILRHFQREEIKFHCYICDFMTLKRDMFIEHFKKHSKHHSKLDEIKYKYQLETSKKREKRYPCDQCDYITYEKRDLKRHNLVHLKPEEIEYFYCYHCSYKAKQKCNLTRHIFRHFKNEKVPFHCYICDFMTLKRDLIVEHFKKHPEHHSKCDETKYKYQLETKLELKLEKS